MRKLFLLPFLFLAAIPAYGQTSSNGRIMEGPLASRPAVCSPGDYYVSTDTAPVVEYKCSTGNNWAAEATGGGGGSPSAGSNGTVQCGDGAGNYIACHVNDNVTFPGALFVNENLIVSGSSSLAGSLTLNGNGNAGNAALKVFASDGIRYASPSGNDSNDGLSWGTAKLTVMGACEALPGGATSPATCGSGTVQFMDLTFAEPTSTCGFFLMGGADPNFASPPACWIKWGGGSHGLAIVGIPARANGPNPKQARALMQGGSSADLNHPGIYLSALSGAISFHNVSIQFPGRGIVVGECSNQTRTATCNTSNITFDNVTANINDVVGNGPTWDITGQSFWIWLINGCGAGGTDDTNSPLSDKAAAVLLDGRSNAGVGLIFITDFFTDNGGIKLYAGTNFGQVVVRNMTTEGLKGEPGVWIVSTGGSGDKNVTANISDLQMADATTTSPGVQNDISTGSSVLAADIEGATTNVVGKAIVLSQYPGNFTAATVSPLQNRQTGFFDKYVVGQNGDLDRLLAPTPVRYLNLASTASGSWTTSFAGSTSSVAACADPAGGTLAGCITYLTGGTAETAMYFVGNAPIVSGDWYMITAMIKSTTANGYSGNTPIEFTLAAQGFGAGDFCNGTSSGIVNAPGLQVGDGAWERVWALCQVTAAPANAGIAMVALTDATHNIAVYGPTLIHVGTGTISNNEAWAISSALQPYSNTCTVNQLCTVAGVVTGGGGSGTVTHTPGNLLEGQNIVGSGVNVNDAQISSAQIDFVPFFTTDWGTTVQTMLAGLPTANTKSYVTLAGTLTGSAHNSNVNPFVNLTGDASIFAQLPCYFLNLNGATSQWLINANDVVLNGCGVGGNSILTANGSFPTNTPMLFFGSSSLRNGVRLENYRINCGTVTGCTPLVAENQQEFSGLNHVNFVGGNSAGATAAAVEFEDPNGGGHYLVNDIQIGQAGANDFFYAHSQGASGALINRMTCNNTGFNTGLDCFHEDSIDGNPTFNFLNSAHGEGLTYVAEFANHTGGSADHIDCTGTCTDVLHIDVGALVVDSNYLYCSACTNIVNDLSQSPNVVLPRTSFVNGIAHYSNGPEFAKSYQAAAITDTGLTAGQSVCTSTNGLLTTSGCPAIFLANRVVSGTTATDTILAGDCFNRVTYQTSVNVAVTLPTPTTLGIAGCALRLVNATTGASTAITVTPTTLTIGPAAAANFQIQKGQFCTLTVDGTNWDTDCTFASTTNCASSASPAVCGAAAYGSVAIPTGAGSSTLTINTTAVTANSVIVFYPDDTLGTKLGVTCNSTLATLVGGSAVTARTAGTSFQITFNGTIATNPVCGNYEIVN